MLRGVKLIGLRSSDDHGAEVGYLSASLEQSIFLLRHLPFSASRKLQLSC
jgi:hypothetical protein